MDDLRHQANQMVHTISDNLEVLFTFAETAITVEQLDRIRDVMEMVELIANDIINPPPPPPPVAEDADDAMSGITFE